MTVASVLAVEVDVVLAVQVGAGMDLVKEGTQIQLVVEDLWCHGDTMHLEVQGDNLRRPNWLILLLVH
jgi:hypothetical protein